MNQLESAIEQKKDEIRQREADLRAPEYLDKGWASKEIALLNGEIGRIRHFLKEGGELDLARCCKEDKGNPLCLIAHRLFDWCGLVPGSCRFSHKAGPVQVEPKQEVLL